MTMNKEELDSTLAQATAWCTGYAEGQERMRRVAANLMQQAYNDENCTDRAGAFWIAMSMICELEIEPLRYDGVPT